MSVVFSIKDKLYFRNKNRKHWFFLYLVYLFALLFLFKVLGTHVSTLGDYRLYSQGLFSLAFSAETIVLNIYTFLLYIGVTPATAGCLFLIYFFYFYVQRVRQNFINVWILLSVLNPFTIQFFLYASKEAILTILTILFCRLSSYFFRYLALLIALFVRPMYVAVFLTAIVTLRKKTFGLSKKSIFLIAITSAFPTIFVIEQNNVVESIDSILRGSFLYYTSSATNRYWVPEIYTLFSFDFLFWIFLGLFTVFFGFFSISFYSPLFFFIGTGKLLLLSSLFRLNVYVGYFWVAAILIYAVPLSVYNVGSSMRYTIPLMVIMLFLYALFKGKITNNKKLK